MIKMSSVPTELQQHRSSPLEIKHKDMSFILRSHVSVVFLNDCPTTHTHTHLMSKEQGFKLSFTPVVQSICQQLHRQCVHPQEVPNKHHSFNALDETQLSNTASEQSSLNNERTWSRACAAWTLVTHSPVQCCLIQIPQGSTVKRLRDKGKDNVD